MKEQESQGPEYKTISSCRSCGSDKLKTVINLGNHKIVGFSTFEETPVIPLEVCLCDNCKLLQLRHTTRPDLLWNENYGYRSGVNEAMVKHLAGIAESVQHEVELKDGDVVVDIGCNDGTLLDKYSANVLQVGFDPSKNMFNYARELLKDKDHFLFNDFFSSKSYQESVDKKAKIITAISMFYDLDDPKTFLNDCKDILADDGILVIQQNYAVGMIENCSFDNICHEHVEYYTLISMRNLLSQVGLEIYHVEENQLNGGSFRTYICKSGHRKADDTVGKMLKKELSLGLDGGGVYSKFAEMVERVSTWLREFIGTEASKGKTVYAYGASTRGGTLLQACGLDKGQIKAAVERNPDKWGKTMETANLPIISEQQAREDQPDYMIILPWFFSDHFIEREAEYLTKGGTFIVPLPEPRLVHA